MIEPRYRWTFPDREAPAASVTAMATERGISTRLAALLASRGATTDADVAAWFAEPLSGLHDPRLLPDADRVLERIRAARDRAERVLVFGDFDADGLTGLAIMTLALRRFGVAVEPYVPSRLDEGHGLSLAAIDAAVAGGSSVIVTVDCGSTSVAEVAVAQRARDSTSSSPTTTASRASCRRPSRSSTRTDPMRPTRTVAWPAAASRSRSPSCSSPTSPAARPRPST